MVVLLQQSVPPIYATCFSKKYSMKPRLLSRTWPNISRLEHTVLILRPSMFIAAVVKRLVPASLNAWRHRTASVKKGADGWKWPKPKNLGKTKKNQTPPPPKKQKKTIFRESWLGPPPSKESRFFFVFPRFWPSVGYFKEIGMNHRQSCPLNCSKFCRNDWTPPRFAWLKPGRICRIDSFFGDNSGWEILEWLRGPGPREEQ